ncbi:hypothetical protein LCGC14_0948630, partial [marine sediment metagenome]
EVAVPFYLPTGNIMSSPSTSGKYVLGGGILVLITDASVEQTGLVAGRTYEAVAFDGGALVKYVVGSCCVNAEKLLVHIGYLLPAL